MKIVLADRDLTEFDWVGFVGAWAIALGLFWLVPGVLAGPLAAVPVLGWMYYRKKRRERLAEQAD